MNIRIQPPASSLELNKKSEFFLNISNYAIQEYESGFLCSLLDYIKSDEMLNHFHTRLICECNNVVKVITLVREVDIMDLQELVNNLSNATDLKDISKLDSDFHKCLFKITGDVDFFKWWLGQSSSMNKVLLNFWENIGFGTARHMELIKIHNQIFQSIKNKEPEKGVAAMQKHFSILLFQLLGTMY
jgi:DNA-binding GntR family transcriptional regulator